MVHLFLDKAVSKIGEVFLRWARMKTIFKGCNDVGFLIDLTGISDEEFSCQVYFTSLLSQNQNRFGTVWKNFSSKLCTFESLNSF
mgnify:CR=1 FL=1